ncbi:MAG: YidC/Oxa1 family membrane protein insertase [Caldilineales bacterium]|nr:YidC/Oxa1 family membrane protein insertase [Caldilineales bacterium]
MKFTRKRLVILGLLLLAAVLLSSCGGVTVDPATGEEVYNPGIFEIIAGPLRQAIVFFESLLEPYIGALAWGWAIIVVTLIIRLLLLPLGLRQMRSMREASVKTKQLQPEIDALKKKYGKDKKKMQEEQMKLYQQHGITQAQMAGCLPTLLQMPILFAFYYAILGLVVTSNFKDNSPFYFIPSLAYPEYRSGLSWLTSDFSLQKLASPEVWPYLVLPAILAVTQFFMTRMSQSSQPTMGSNDNPAAGMMGQMSILMTGMFVFFALQVPAGLSLYWVVGNVLAMAQQYYVNRQKDQWESAASLTPALAASSAGGADATIDSTVVSKNGNTASQAIEASGESSSSQARRKRRKRR